MKRAISFQRTFLLVLALGLGLVASACSARYIREAQDHFSRAAAVENARSQASYSATAEQSAGDPAHDYRLSLALLERELGENGAELREDRLYGTALVLKALCHWRLADLDGEDPHAAELQATLERIDEALDAGATVGPRDRAMVLALPALRDHDKGRAAVDYARAKEHFESALEDLGEVLKSPDVPARHPVRVYLYLAQLATVREWAGAAHRLQGTNTERVEAKRAVVDHAQKVLTSFNNAFPRYPGAKEAAEHYAQAIGLGATFTWK